MRRLDPTILSCGYETVVYPDPSFGPERWKIHTREFNEPDSKMEDKIVDMLVQQLF